MASDRSFANHEPLRSHCDKSLQAATNQGEIPTAEDDDDDDDDDNDEGFQAEAA